MVQSLEYRSPVITKYHSKSLQQQARKWWRTLSINEQKAFQKKHGFIYHAALPHEIAEMFDKENPHAEALHAKLTAEATYLGHNQIGGEITYLFDSNKNEIGYYPTSFPDFCVEMRGRVWNEEWKEAMVFTRIKFD